MPISVFFRGFSSCPYYQGVWNSETSTRRELTNTKDKIAGTHVPREKIADERRGLCLNWSRRSSKFWTTRCWLVPGHVCWTSPYWRTGWDGKEGSEGLRLSLPSPLIPAVIAFVTKTTGVKQDDSVLNVWYIYRSSSYTSTVHRRSWPRLCY